MEGGGAKEAWGAPADEPPSPAPAPAPVEDAHSAQQRRARAQAAALPTPATVQAVAVAEAPPPVPPQYVRLDVGGTRYTTLLSTLCKHPDSMLATMFHGLSEEDDGSPMIGLAQDNKGTYIIDRDGPCFRHILNYLRHEGPGEPPVPFGKEERRLLRLEAEYLLLPELARECMLPPPAKPTAALRDLSGMNLAGRDLCGRALSGFDLSGSDLSGADLSEADLCKANLTNANLTDANLGGANLSGANTSGANLGHAKLDGATVLPPSL